MEISTAFELMGRDAAALGSSFPVGTLVVVLTFVLPFASLAMVRRGYRVAPGSFSVAVGVFAEWFLYYATG